MRNIEGQRRIGAVPPPTCTHPYHDGGTSVCLGACINRFGACVPIDSCSGQKNDANAYGSANASRSERPFTPRCAILKDSVVLAQFPLQAALIRITTGEQRFFGGACINQFGACVPIDSCSGQKNDASAYGSANASRSERPIHT